MLYYARIILSVNLCTKGATRITVGNAIENANTHALSHIVIILSTIPTLNNEITKDIKPDINSAIKNANTTLRYLGLNIGVAFGVKQ
tara:strand:- start:970 stop:1230 length:261 start_codon:yes stop_codon:yes gene_type:complete